MKRTIWTALAAIGATILLVYGRWVVSDFLWLHEQRMAAERQAAFIAGQQDAVRQIQQAQKAK